MWFYLPSNDLVNFCESRMFVIFRLPNISVYVEPSDFCNCSKKILKNEGSWINKITTYSPPCKSIEFLY